MVTFIKVMWWIFVVTNIIYIPLNLFVEGYERNIGAAIGGTIKGSLQLSFLFAIRGYLPF